MCGSAPWDVSAPRNRSGQAVLAKRREECVPIWPVWNGVAPPPRRAQKETAPAQLVGLATIFRMMLLDPTYPCCPIRAKHFTSRIEVGQFYYQENP